MMVYRSTLWQSLGVMINLGDVTMNTLEEMKLMDMYDIDRHHYIFSRSSKASGAFVYSRLAFSIKLAMGVK